MLLEPLIKLLPHLPRSRVRRFGDRGGTEKLKLDGRFGEPSCSLRVLAQVADCDMYENWQPDDDEEAVDEGDGVAVVHGLNGLRGVDEIELDGLGSCNNCRW